MSDFIAQIQGILDLSKAESSMNSFLAKYKNKPLDIKVNVSGLDDKNFIRQAQNVGKQAGKVYETAMQKQVNTIARTQRNALSQPLNNITKEQSKYEDLYNRLLTKRDRERLAKEKSVQAKISQMQANAAQKNAYNNSLVQTGKTNIQNWKKQYERQVKSQAEIVQKYSKVLDSKSIDAKISSLKSSRDKYNSDSNQYKQLNASIKELETTYQNAKDARDAFNKDSSNSNFDSFVNKYDKVDDVLKRAGNEMKILAAEQDKLVSSSSKASAINSFESYFNENTKAAKKYSTEIDVLRQKLQNMTTVADKANFDTEFKNLKSKINAEGLTGKSLLDEAKRGFGAIAQFAGTYGLIQSGVDKIKSSVSELKDVDTILTEISKTSDLTTSQLKKLGETSFDSASKWEKGIRLFTWYSRGESKRFLWR